MPLATKELRREYQRRWRNAKRADFFKDKECVWCGRTRNLELDHIKPEEKEDNNIWSWSESRRNAELAKCRVLCEECHQIRTIVWYEVRRKHGTSIMYDWGCRCDPCKATQRLRKARWRAKTGKH